VEPSRRYTSGPYCSTTRANAVCGDFPSMNKLPTTGHGHGYSIVCATPWGPHPNGFLSRDAQVGVPKFHQPRLWKHITSCADLRLQQDLKQSCSPCWELSNGKSHIAYWQGNWVDFQLLVVDNQIANLTPGHSFDHNLCYRRPNGRCKPILDIYTWKLFNDIKNASRQGVLTPAITLWRFGSPFETLTPNMGVHLGVWRFIPSHSLHSQEHVKWLLGPLLGPQPCHTLPWLRAQG
jgi:hypothetical protein